MDQNDWRSFASCKDVDTSLFFPVSIGKYNKSEIKELLDLCDHCPVAANCLYEACSTESIGIWARTTLVQREAFLKARDSSHELTVDECQSYYDFLKENKVYPYTRRHRSYTDTFVNANE